MPIEREDARALAYRPLFAGRLPRISFVAPAELERWVAGTKLGPLTEARTRPAHDTVTLSCRSVASCAPDGPRFPSPRRERAVRSKRPTPLSGRPHYQQSRWSFGD